MLEGTISNWIEDHEQSNDYQKNYINQNPQCRIHNIKLSYAEDGIFYATIKLKNMDERMKCRDHFAGCSKGEREKGMNNYWDFNIDASRHLGTSVKLSPYPGEDKKNIKLMTYRMLEKLNEFEQIYPQNIFLGMKNEFGFAPLDFEEQHFQQIIDLYKHGNFSEARQLTQNASWQLRCLGYNDLKTKIVDEFVAANDWENVERAISIANKPIIFDFAHSLLVNDEVRGFANHREKLKMIMRLFGLCPNQPDAIRLKKKIFYVLCDEPIFSDDADLQKLTSLPSEILCSTTDVLYSKNQKLKNQQNQIETLSKQILDLKQNLNIINEYAAKNEINLNPKEADIENLKPELKQPELSTQLTKDLNQPPTPFSNLYSETQNRLAQTNTDEHQHKRQRLNDSASPSNR